jgi:hypothetical protein
MSEEARSEQACPVCSQHTLALDRPPEIDVMGVQQYSDIVGMGDLHNEGAVGIVCLNCKTHWRDKAAFDRGEPEPDVASDAPSEADLADADGGGDDGGGDGGGGDGGE